MRMSPERSAPQDTNAQNETQNMDSFESNEIKNADTRRPVESETAEKCSEQTDNARPILDDNGAEVSNGGSLSPNKTFTLNGIEYRTDDNGNIYSIDGKPLPNQIYRINGHEYKTDDEGRIYQVDGKALENETFVIHGKEYRTDSQGLLTHFNGKPLHDIEYNNLDKSDFNEIKSFLASYYSDAVNSNMPWTWNDCVPNGSSLTAGQKEAIRYYAKEAGKIPAVPIRTENGYDYADFSNYVVFQCSLDKGMWTQTDKEQFDDCNQQLKEAVSNNPSLASQFNEKQLEDIQNGDKPSGYTWHHSEKEGVMQLVPFGVHNSTYHCGGRSEGHWADAPRQKEAKQ